MRDDRGRRTVADLMPDVPGLVPPAASTGTTGLLLLTNDGELAHRITHPSSGWKKRPPHFAQPRPRRSHRRPVRRPDPGGRQDAPGLSTLSRTHHTTTLDLIIHEGRNRIIRRACAAVGLRLDSLHRIRVGPVTLGDLPQGQYRRLTPEELEALR